MQSNDFSPKRKLQASKLTAALAMLDAARSTIEAELAELETQPEQDEYLDAAQCKERYGIGGEAIRARAAAGELTVSRGARGKLLVLDSEMRRFIASRPYNPGPRRAPVADLDSWDAEADRSLKIVGRK